jgi:hypothetical protein
MSQNKNKKRVNVKETLGNRMTKALTAVASLMGSNSRIQPGRADDCKLTRLNISEGAAGGGVSSG